MNTLSQYQIDLIIHPGSGEQFVTFEVEEREGLLRYRSRSPLFRHEIKAGVFHCQHHAEARGNSVDKSSKPDLEIQDDRSREGNEDVDQFSSPPSNWFEGKREDHPE